MTLQFSFVLLVEKNSLLHVVIYVYISKVNNIAIDSEYLLSASFFLLIHLYEYSK